MTIASAPSTRRSRTPHADSSSSGGQQRNWLLAADVPMCADVVFVVTAES